MQIICLSLIEIFTQKCGEILHLSLLHEIMTQLDYNWNVSGVIIHISHLLQVTNTLEFAKTWGSMKSNRSEEMNYEKMSRAMRYHYGCERQGRKGHLAMVKEKRLYYKYVDCHVLNDKIISHSLLSLDLESLQRTGKAVTCLR